MMRKLKALLHSMDQSIQFHHVGNRIWYVHFWYWYINPNNWYGRCFAHVINISVQHILAELKNTPSIFEDYLSDSISPSMDTYGDALWEDPVGCVWKLVSECRVSSQCYSTLHAVIMNGNQMKSWPQEVVVDFDSKTLSDAQKMGGELPNVQLLWDCETWWSSTFLMIACVLTLYPVWANQILKLPWKFIEIFLGIALVHHRVRFTDSSSPSAFNRWVQSPLWYLFNLMASS